jgi:enoyl-CoA hydratase
MSPCNKKKEDYKDYGSLEYWREGRIAHVLLNRPQRLNAIDLQLPFQLQNAIQQANWDDEVHAVLLYGAGNAFCSGYDLISFAEEKVDNKSQERYVNQGPTWDPSLDYQRVKNIT